jgi:hypothetical protein
MEREEIYRMHEHVKAICKELELPANFFGAGVLKRDDAAPAEATKPRKALGDVLLQPTVLVVLSLVFVAVMILVAYLLGGFKD